MSNLEIQIWAKSAPRLAIDPPEEVKAGEGPFVSDCIYRKIICLEKYVSEFIEVLERAKFTVAAR